MPLWAWVRWAARGVILLSVGVGVGLFLHKVPADKESTPIVRNKPEPQPVKLPPKPPLDEDGQNPAPKDNQVNPRNDGDNPPAAQPAPEHSLSRRIFQLTPAGDMLAISDEGDKTWRLVNPRTNEQLREFKGHEDAISAVAFSADGSRALTGGHDKQMIVWDVKTARIIRRIRSARAPLISVALSSDGKNAVGTDITKNVMLWDVESGAGTPTVIQATSSAWLSRQMASTSSAAWTRATNPMLS